jgi:hypothetical protein
MEFYELSGEVRTPALEHLGLLVGKVEVEPDADNDEHARGLPGEWPNS